MLKSLEKLQNGLLPYISFRKSVATTRISELALSPFTTFETAHTSIVTSLDIHRIEDRYLLSAADNGDIAIHDLWNYTGNLSFDPQIICSIKRDAPLAHKLCIKTAQWYPFDTGLFITCSTDKTLKIWDTINTKPSVTFLMDYNVSGHHMSTVSPNNALIAVALEHSRVLLLDARSGCRSHELQGPGKATAVVRWSPLSEYLLATGDVDGRILLWDIRYAESYLKALDFNIVPIKSNLVKAHNGVIRAMNFTDDGLYLVSLGADNALRLWDVALHKKTRVNFPRIPPIEAQFQPKMDICYVSSTPVIFVPANNSIYVHYLFTGFRKRILRGNSNVITSCVFKTSTCQLYIGGYNTSILLWTPDGFREFLSDKRQKFSKQMLRHFHMDLDTNIWLMSDNE